MKFSIWPIWVAEESSQATMVNSAPRRGDETPYVIIAAPPVASIALALGAPEGAAALRVLADESMDEADFRLESFQEETPPSGAKLLKDKTGETP